MVQSNRTTLAGWISTKYMGYTLLPFQKIGVDFLLSKGSAILGDDVGLGKTLQAIHAVETLPDISRVLVLCPAILKYQWQSELNKFVPHASSVVITGSPIKRALLWMSDCKYIVANYELLLRDFPLMNQDWDVIIADECTYISSPSAKRSKLIKRLHARFRFALTGTLISNRPEEVWNIVDFVKPQALGSYYSFLWRYCIKNIWGSIYAYKNLPELNNRLKPYFIRRTKEEVLLELPEKFVSDIPVELSDEEMKLYTQIKKETLLDIEKSLIDKIEDPTTMTMSAVKMIRLRQACNSMELVGSSIKSSKLEALRVILESLKDRKVIIFSEFSTMCDIIEREVGGLKITGDVDIYERERIIEKFNNNPIENILIMSSAGRYGLNLQAASVIVNFDLPWSIASLTQRIGRAHRMGQTENVLVYRLIGKKTVDEYIAKKLLKKQDLSDKVLIGEVLEELQYD